MVFLARVLWCCCNLFQAACRRCSWMALLTGILFDHHSIQGATCRASDSRLADRRRRSSRIARQNMRSTTWPKLVCAVSFCGAALANQRRPARDQRQFLVCRQVGARRGSGPGSTRGPRRNHDEPRQCYDWQHRRNHDEQWRQCHGNTGGTPTSNGGSATGNTGGNPTSNGGSAASTSSSTGGTSAASGGSMTSGGVTTSSGGSSGDGEHGSPLCQWCTRSRRNRNRLWRNMSGVPGCLQGESANQCQNQYSIRTASQGMRRPSVGACASLATPARMPEQGWQGGLRVFALHAVQPGHVAGRKGRWCAEWLGRERTALPLRRGRT